MTAILTFGDFRLDRDAALLTRGGTPVPLAPRPFDALALLAGNPGVLVTKDRLFADVWNGVIVGDDALTQCIKDLRRALGDDARAPRFIETVPKRGYRFIAPVGGVSVQAGDTRRWPLVLGGTAGGALAGLAGGILYGLIAGAGNPAALVILLVMAVVTALLGAAGALALSLGMALASRLAQRDWWFSAASAGIAGFLVGDIAHAVMSGSFTFLVGRPHDAFTGGMEGAILGAGLAMGAQLAGGIDGARRRVVAGGAIGGGLAGALIAALGGRLMAASLGGLARRSHGADADLGGLAILADGGGVLPIAVAAGEGALFGAMLVAGILAARRQITN